jgi:hypothetical protein
MTPPKPKYLSIPTAVPLSSFVKDTPLRLKEVPLV